jgi:hypothetical protein
MRWGWAFSRLMMKGPPDALAVQVALVDRQVVEQGDVVGRIRVPAVLGGDGSAGPAAGSLR